MENDENTELFLFVDKVGVCGGVWDQLAHSWRNVEVRNSGVIIHFGIKYSTEHEISLWYLLHCN